MTFPEEPLARNLYRAMKERFADIEPSTRCSVDGRGVHWHCIGRRGARSAEVACFASREVEYATTYRDRDEPLTHGRTSSKNLALDAAATWLVGASVEQLYEQFEFVDKGKRALGRLLAHVVEQAPDLAVLPQSGLVQQPYGEFYNLQFSDAQRGCELSFYGKNEQPDARFSWDDCTLFEVRADDPDVLAELLSRWVCNREMPSALREAYPWLEMDSVADAYETGLGVEGEFVHSWRWIREFFDDLPFNFTPNVVELIDQITQLGFHRTLRAGQSMASLILSRSRRHGMNAGAPRVVFIFADGEVRATLNGTRQDRSLSHSSIELTPGIVELLRILEAEPIR